MKMPKVKLYPRELPSKKISYYLHYKNPRTGDRERELIGQVSENDAREVQAKKIKELKMQVLGVDDGPVMDVGLQELFEYYIINKKIRDSSKERYRKHADKLSGQLLQLQPRLKNDVKILSSGLFEFGCEKIYESGLAKDTYDDMITFASAAFDYGIKRRLMLENPADDIDKFNERSKTKQIKYFNKQQLFRLNRQLPDKWLDVYQFYLQTGLRRGELTNLIWDHVRLDAKNPTIYIGEHSASGKLWQPKNDNSYRHLPLSDKAQQILRNRKGRHPVFVFSMNGKKLSDNTVKQTFYRTRKKLGFTFGSVHTLRHTYGTQQAMADINLYKLMKLMGHGSIETTMKYAHLSPSYLSEGIDNVRGL